MWPDNETELDFLNFSGVADTVAEIIVQAHGRPISIGVSGAWGVGKSSMIQLTKRSLAQRPMTDGERQFIFVEFNAWLYQGYDDARAALMDVIATKLEAEAEARETGVDKAKALLKRVNWLRAAKLFAGSAVAMSMGLPPAGLIGGIFDIGRRAFTDGVDKKLLDDAEGKAGELKDQADDLLRPKESTSPPKEIQALRDAFEETLQELNVTLVVLIDDLDRCLPETTISTLEAIRLFLFLKGTAFVIAADNEMIKHAVRKHFEGVPDELLVTNYFDKLIQVPIRVPPLGTQEVRAYMMLLFVENSELDDDVREKIRAGVCAQLRQTWQGKRVDRAFVETLHQAFPPELIGRFDTADRLAPLMTTASGILGNPRLIKRFLNALAIRMAISNAQGVGVDEAVLAKLLLFERLGNPKAYEELMAAVTSSENGKPGFISDWEEMTTAGQSVDLPPPWNDSFVEEWLRLPPRLADTDLRGALYVSREHAPLITPEDRLSSEAADLLAALLKHPEVAETLKDRLTAVPRVETAIIMDRLLDRARQEQEWGVPPILEACLVVAQADPPQGARLAAFLAERPPAQILPNIVPKLGDQPWAAGLFEKWSNSDVSRTVKTAIKKAEEK
ncbi:ATPase [Burkholderia ubonensis]|uniref:KAP family P-loop NTPase fold protein n=1 Tax=Burkholderia ubonensis TaxID=101571 RepID=UPI00075426CF|nr:P-loop NTPase fold protein [Burkholderia ubonensis]AOK60167.1 ATPase [Burkholderia ubonensis]KVW42644.1 ATPase [Burkholderia ubonensis]KWC51934.1 ATPase [Burkholderia ubonensis]